MRKLQQAALALNVPAAQAHVPLLACVDLESRKRLHGLSNGPSISRDALSKVGDLPSAQPVNQALPPSDVPAQSSISEEIACRQAQAMRCRMMAAPSKMPQTGNAPTSWAPGAISVIHPTDGSCPWYSSRPRKAVSPLVQEELERLESGGCAGPSGHQHAAHGSATDGIAAAALVYFRKLGRLASCAANLRWAAAGSGTGAMPCTAAIHLCNCSPSAASLLALLYMSLVWSALHMWE